MIKYILSMMMEISTKQAWLTKPENCKPLLFPLFEDWPPTPREFITAPITYKSNNKWVTACSNSNQIILHFSPCGSYPVKKLKFQIQIKTHKINHNKEKRGQTRVRSGTMPSPWSPTLKVPRSTLCEICPTRLRGTPALTSLPANL